MGFRQGRCLLRDYQRRLGAIQVDFDHAPDLLEALRTDPNRPGTESASELVHVEDLHDGHRLEATT